jgi:hypothetical protein
MPKKEWLAEVTAQQLDDAWQVACNLGWNVHNEGVNHGELARQLSNVWPDDPVRSARAVSLVLALLARADATHVSHVRLQLSDWLLQKLRDERRYPDLSEDA